VRAIFEEFVSVYAEIWVERMRASNRTRWGVLVDRKGKQKKVQRIEESNLVNNSKFVRDGKNQGQDVQDQEKW
jgi:hypothetical protein